MKKSVRVFGIFALVPLLMAGLCAGFVWRGARQHENDKALLDAIKADNASAVIAALKRGANPNARDMPNDSRTLTERFLDLMHHTVPPNKEHIAALYLAVSRNPENVALVKALLDAGADLNPPSRYYGNPLIVAEGWQHYAVAHLLLEYHANIHSKNDEGETALFEAAAHGDCDEIEYLLQQGANIEEENGRGISSLCRAAFDNAPSVVKCLIEHGANINHRDKSGRTALGHVRTNNYPAVKKLLLQAGAVE